MLPDHSPYLEYNRGFDAGLQQSRRVIERLQKKVANQANQIALLEQSRKDLRKEIARLKIASGEVMPQSIGDEVI